MPSPFPGMDPYLEHPTHWPGRHNAIIVALQLELGPRLRPRYAVYIEQRSYLRDVEDLVFIGRPDVAVRRALVQAPSSARPAPTPTGAVVVEVPIPEEVRDAYIEIRDAASKEIVTVLEVLSPTNKAPGEGRHLYERKRRAVLGSLTNLVEVDLLRGGQPLPLYGAVPASETYRILVSRGDSRPRADLFSFGVRDPIPTFRLPLRPHDEEPHVDLRALLDDLYDRAGWDLAVDYHTDPIPPLDSADRDWAVRLLRDAGRR